MAKKQSAKQTYTVVRTVRYDGDWYQPGDQVDMAPEQAAELLQMGVLSDEKPAAKTTTTPPVPPTPPVDPDPPTPPVDPAPPTDPTTPTDPQPPVDPTDNNVNTTA